jgi:hypothetical protein
MWKLNLFLTVWIRGGVGARYRYHFFLRILSHISSLGKPAHNDNDNDILHASSRDNVNLAVSVGGVYRAEPPAAGEFPNSPVSPVPA